MYLVHSCTIDEPTRRFRDFKAQTSAIQSTYMKYSWKYVSGMRISRVPQVRQFYMTVEMHTPNVQSGLLPTSL